jgi:hypothetical protein
MRRLLTSAFIAVAILGVSGTLFMPCAQAAPQPSIVPVSWELTFRHGPVERLIMPIDGKNQTFWYMRYTVINNTGKDILFTPDFELSTDTGQVQQAFKDVPNAVFDKIKSTYNDPLMLSPTQILGKLLQGDDNAKNGVIIFSNVDSDARDFQVFISGLSGETAEVQNPLTNKPVVLQKTLILDYNVPGQSIGIQPQPKLKSVKWVMK